VQEGVLIDEFFANGQYRNAIRMYLLQNDYLQAQAGIGT
jgi:diamine N-acetyltransferase